VCALLFTFCRSPTFSHHLISHQFAIDAIGFYQHFAKMLRRHAIRLVATQDLKFIKWIGWDATNVALPLS
jgi:hypothetical protein